MQPTVDKIKKKHHQVMREAQPTIFYRNHHAPAEKYHQAMRTGRLRVTWRTAMLLQKHHQVIREAQPTIYYQNHHAPAEEVSSSHAHWQTWSDLANRHAPTEALLTHTRSTT
jgi:hypothetical protein